MDTLHPLLEAVWKCNDKRWGNGWGTYCLQTLISRPVLFCEEPDSRAGWQGWGEEWSSHNPRVDGQPPSVPLRHTQVCGGQMIVLQGHWESWWKFSPSQFGFLPEVLSNLGDPRWLVVGKFNVHLQDKSEGGQGELQAFQSGADHPKCHHMTTRGFGPVSRDLWKADPIVWPTWSLSVTTWAD